MLPILNVKGFYGRNIYVMPQDGRNLNRMFPGKPDGSTSEQLANWLVTEVFPKADAYIDCHGGDLDEGLAPFTIFPAGCEKSQALALRLRHQDSGCRRQRRQFDPAPLTRSAFRASCRKSAATGYGTRATVSQVTDGIRRVMQHIGMLPGEAPMTGA